jgi:hypothetical protein
MVKIDDQFGPDEKAVWRSAPDRRLYIRWARRLEHSMATIAALTTFCLLHFLMGASVALSMVTVLVIGAVFVPMRDWRIRKTTYLGEYAVSDTRIMRVNMRGNFAALPRDAKLVHRVRGTRTARAVQFSHPDCGPIRYACLTEADARRLEEVLSQPQQAL